LSQQYFSFFNSLNSESSLGFRLVDIFSSHFSFHQANCKDKCSKSTHLHNLNDIVLNVSLYLNLVVVISDASIRNNVAISITYIYLHSNPVKKTLYHAIGMISSEPELFAIRCSINQAVKIPEVSHIIFITDLIHMANQMFDSTTYSYQQQLIAILKDLQLFFNKYSSNLVEFWDCSSNINWPL